jgi:hypothetical protein
MPQAGAFVELAVSEAWYISCLPISRRSLLIPSASRGTLAHTERLWEVFWKSSMVDIVELRETAKRLREWARQIRRESDATPYATSLEDSGLLDKAAKGLEAHAMKSRSFQSKALKTGRMWVYRVCHQCRAG